MPTGWLRTNQQLRRENARLREDLDIAEAWFARAGLDPIADHPDDYDESNRDPGCVPGQVHVYQLTTAGVYCAFCGRSNIGPDGRVRL